MATQKRTKKRRGPKRRASKKSMKRASRKSAKRSGKKSGKKKSGKKRSGKKNAFFSLMLDAKKRDAPAFVYNGKTYKKKTKGHLVYYKA